jgi:hypothetical protein
MKNYDETRQTLKELGYRRSDRTANGVHDELWYPPVKREGPFKTPTSVSYQTACFYAGLTPVPTPKSRDPKPSYKRKKTLQAKHLGTRNVLEFIVDHCKKTGHLWTTFYDLKEGFPDWEKIPDGVVRAKMASLVKKGYLDGCLCGCRGDFEPQRAAYEFLAQDRSRDDIKPGFSMSVDGRALRDMWWEGTAMCVQFHDTGAIIRFGGARLTSYSMGAEVKPVEVLGRLEVAPEPHITMHATMTVDPAPIEFIPITFVLDGELK